MGLASGWQGNWAQKKSLNSNPGTPGWEVGVPSDGLATSPSTHTQASCIRKPVPPALKEPLLQTPPCEGGGLSYRF